MKVLTSLYCLSAVFYITATVYGLTLTVIHFILLKHLTDFHLLIDIRTVLLLLFVLLVVPVLGPVIARPLLTTAYTTRPEALSSHKPVYVGVFLGAVILLSILYLLSL